MRRWASRMASPDDDLLALLRAVPNLNVWDGYVDADETAKVISVPLPYVAFLSSTGRDWQEGFCGGVSGQVVEFQLTGVGSTRRQAKWALGKVRTALSRKRVNGELVVRSDVVEFVRREDDYTLPGGEPLFYGVDRYSVGVNPG